jgi:RND family efflux transporter MFP subunit
MHILGQIALTAAVVGGLVLGLVNVSEDARVLVRAAGIDPTPFAFAAHHAPGPPAPAERRPQGPTLVVTAEVTEAQAATRLRTIGTARAIRSVALYAQSSGIVTAIGFVPGGRVEAGHILAALDPTEQEIALDRAEVAAAAARADLDRISSLAERNAASQVALDAARREVAKAELDVRQAKLDLERRLVRAPFAGIVGLSEVEPGDYILPTTVIGTIDDRSRLEIDLFAPERFASLITLGQTVEAETVARPGERFSGEITAIDSQVDPASRTLRMRAAIENPEDRLRPGFSFTVTLEFAGAAHVALPALAVQWQMEGPFVWKVDAGKASQVPVEVVERNGEQVLVRGALAPGDRVVTEGVLKLRPGSEVAEAPSAGRGT